ncbi:hypothetical protein KDA_44510 [Dictyobacter alpinus]|uniref:Zinc finger DksA/TraR C4-type domain-containing protein n=1 Tax=Dictyobacter alpinus TaxID=2014873 RepID=A0A402BCF4_9CHLR|nr:TraR/DksA family transcriptional regulator [Dictyobacter alpinus]GCE28967.1 hypothetical protein KDA_44510 [Dictyobacter alpinus]
MAIDTKKMQKRLEDIRQELEGNLKDLTQPSAADYLTDPANDDYQDIEDEAVDEQQEQQDQAVKFNEQTKLDEVNAALKRIEDGTYGHCIVCGKVIPEKRLEAIPWAPRCIEDEEAFEQSLIREDEMVQDGENTRFS